jgi:predicted RNase H-like HicB family nuclease
LGWNLRVRAGTLFSSLHFRAVSHAGDTVEECRENAVEAIVVHIAGLEADGEAVPEEHGEAQLLTVTVAA